MGIAGRNRHDPGEISRHGDLPEVIATPGDHGAVGFERQTVKGVSRNRHYPVQAGRHARVGAIAPSHDRAVALEC